MSYSTSWENSTSRARPKNSSSSSAAPPQPGQDGDRSYVEDSRKIKEAVQKIQTSTADVRKELGLLGTAPANKQGRQRVQDAVKAGRAAAEEAKCLLRALPVMGAERFQEQNLRKLTQQKLTENLMGATQLLEAACREYEAAEVEIAKRPAVTASTSKDKRSSSASAGWLELSEAPADPSSGGVRISTQEQDVSQSEVETHAEIVEEYSKEVMTLHSNIEGLQRVMVDLHQNTISQGEMLDNIENNLSQANAATGDATEQLVQASRHHQRGTKCIYFLLVCSATMAIALVVAVVEKSKRN